jgi:hypothetical protein
MVILLALGSAKAEDLPLIVRQKPAPIFGCVIFHHDLDSDGLTDIEVTYQIIDSPLLAIRQQLSTLNPLFIEPGGQKIRLQKARDSHQSNV